MYYYSDHYKQQIEHDYGDMLVPGGFIALRARFHAYRNSQPANGEFNRVRLKAPSQCVHPLQHSSQIVL
jgi:hypothetical protein